LARKVAALEERSNIAVDGLLQNLKGLQAQQTALYAQQANSVVNSMQAAAYGSRGDVLATNNLLIAGNQLLWTFIDPLLRVLGVTSGPLPAAVTMLSPVGSLLTGYVALGNRQHVRFISGIATFRGRRNVVFDTLRDRIADSLWPEFQQRTNVPVTVVPVGNVRVFIVSAAVRDGVLRIEVEKRGSETVQIAWMVDTGADVG
jgi:hypothetical protein